MRAVQTCASTQ